MIQRACFFAASCVSGSPSASASICIPPAPRLSISPLRKINSTRFLTDIFMFMFDFSPFNHAAHVHSQSIHKNVRKKMAVLLPLSNVKHLQSCSFETTQSPVCAPLSQLSSPKTAPHMYRATIPLEKHRSNDSAAHIPVQNGKKCDRIHITVQHTIIIPFPHISMSF